MFCIYSFDFIKKNTAPQLMIFTPSKFLSKKIKRDLPDKKNSIIEQGNRPRNFPNH